MYNKHTTELHAAVIASVLVASVFAISYVQMALAQGIQTQANRPVELLVVLTRAAVTQLAAA
jgi:hypothetical protein